MSTKKEHAARLALRLREMLAGTANPRFETVLTDEDFIFLRDAVPTQYTAWALCMRGSPGEAAAAAELLKALQAYDDKEAANSSEVTQSILDWTARIIELARKVQQARVDCEVTDVEYDAAFAAYEEVRLRRKEVFRVRYGLEEELKTATTAAAILEAAEE